MHSDATPSRLMARGRGFNDRREVGAPLELFWGNPSALVPRVDMEDGSSLGRAEQ